VLRLQHGPDDRELAALTEQFADIIERGSIERVDAAPIEVRDNDHPELDRVALWFDRHGWPRLRELIDCLNGRPPHP
jgi:hypothetical protein